MNGMQGAAWRVASQRRQERKSGSDEGDRKASLFDSVERHDERFAFRALEKMCLVGSAVDFCEVQLQTL
jgi:hypothetical protein